MIPFNISTGIIEIDWFSYDFKKYETFDDFMEIVSCKEE